MKRIAKLALQISSLSEMAYQVAALAHELLRIRLLAENHRDFDAYPGEERFHCSCFQYAVRWALSWALKDRVGATDPVLTPLVIAALPQPNAAGQFTDCEQADLLLFLSRQLGRGE